LDSSEPEDLIQEWQRRKKIANKQIKAVASTVFTATALSQNGKMDSAASLILNVRMVYAVVRSFGVRPSLTQLIKLYYHVLTTALFSYVFSEAIDQLDDLDIIPDLDGVSGSKLPGLLISSAVDGFFNAAMSFRIGTLTINYIEAPTRFVSNKKQLRKEAIMGSYAQAKNLVKDWVKNQKNSKASNVVNSFKDIVSIIFK
jgi:hypothetical protein